MLLEVIVQAYPQPAVVFDVLGVREGLLLEPSNVGNEAGLVTLRRGKHNFSGQIKDGFYGEAGIEPEEPASLLLTHDDVCILAGCSGGSG